MNEILRVLEDYKELYNAETNEDKKELIGFFVEDLERAIEDE